MCIHYFNCILNFSLQIPYKSSASSLCAVPLSVGGHDGPSHMITRATDQVCLDSAMQIFNPGFRLVVFLWSFSHQICGLSPCSSLFFLMSISTNFASLRAARQHMMCRNQLRWSRLQDTASDFHALVHFTILTVCIFTTHMELHMV